MFPRFWGNSAERPPGCAGAGHWFHGTWAIELSFCCAGLARVWLCRRERCVALIRREAWPFCTTSSSVRICWELEGPKRPDGLCRQVEKMLEEMFQPEVVVLPPTHFGPKCSSYLIGELIQFETFCNILGVFVCYFKVTLRLDAQCVTNAIRKIA